MRLFGLIGFPLGHSFSQKYFSEKFAREGIADARYELFPLENIADLPALLAQHPDLCGLNVTIPHKETVIPFLHELDETARAVGAVNCIKIENQQLKGYNTDVTGFEKSLKAVDGGRWTVDGERRGGDSGWWTGGGEGWVGALILGTGGASKAVAYVLKKLGIPYRFVSRNPDSENQISYETVHRLPSTVYHLIINTTPLGMSPHTGTCPDLPFERLSSQHFVYDLVYNPAETLLLQRAKARGCTVKNGLEMLHLQAEAAWEIWGS
ncbi:MAG: shikimate dehydrogenase [Haliscomenobacteraceae bacterium CHB4]|nr:Shikimate dehydrogenase (NADP(+)) [Saprospiraceae bacterium]MCE7923886.1 shikimate dehydrogenase [Haliscomenobacteraceae bacterium CHB4]